MNMNIFVEQNVHHLSRSLSILLGGGSKLGGVSATVSCQEWMYRPVLVNNHVAHSLLSFPGNILIRSPEGLTHSFCGFSYNLQSTQYCVLNLRLVKKILKVKRLCILAYQLNRLDSLLQQDSISLVITHSNLTWSSVMESHRCQLIELYVSRSTGIPSEDSNSCFRATRSRRVEPSGRSTRMSISLPGKDVPLAREPKMEADLT